MKQSYRVWVKEGARGFFLAPSVAVNATRLIDPRDRSGGYFVRRDTSYPDQRERRAQLREMERDPAEDDGQHDHWIVTARVERPTDVVARGWLSWETIGEVVVAMARKAQEEHG